ncbi:MAG: hypothetical protein M1835_007282 [Candelina submexicana]|nr:MAG: hypothetical protein M1835_007282 [Candelina submexicana]
MEGWYGGKLVKATKSRSVEKLRKTKCDALERPFDVYPKALEWIDPLPIQILQTWFLRADESEETRKTEKEATQEIRSSKGFFVKGLCAKLDPGHIIDFDPIKILRLFLLDLFARSLPL